MDKWNESIKCWNNIYNAQLIIIKMIGYRFYLWWCLLTTTQYIHQRNKHIYLQIMIYTLNLISKVWIKLWILQVKSEPYDWWTFEHNLCLTLKMHRNDTMKMLTNIRKTTKLQGWKPSLVLIVKHQNKNFREIILPNTQSIHHWKKINVVVI